jgi:hypothetical protein
VADYLVKVPADVINQLWERARSAGSDLLAVPSFADACAQWGADQELEACCETVRACWGGAAGDLRAARRPKPLTPAEKALVQYDRFIDMVKDSGCTPAGCIRDALKRLAELEAKQ